MTCPVDNQGVHLSNQSVQPQKPRSEHQNRGLDTPDCPTLVKAQVRGGVQLSTLKGERRIGRGSAHPGTRPHMDTPPLKEHNQ